jgi:hypothetical protein
VSSPLPRSGEEAEASGVAGELGQRMGEGPVDEGNGFQVVKPRGALEAACGAQSFDGFGGGPLSPGGIVASWQR